MFGPAVAVRKVTSIYLKRSPHCAGSTPLSLVLSLWILFLTSTYLPTLRAWPASVTYRIFSRAFPRPELLFIWVIQREDSGDTGIRVSRRTIGESSVT